MEAAGETVASLDARLPAPRIADLAWGAASTGSMVLARLGFG